MTIQSNESQLLKDFSIPEGWSLGVVSDLANINQNTLNSKSTLNEIQYIDISSVGTRILNEVKTIKLIDAPSRAKRIIKDKDILISTVRPNLKSYVFIKKASENLIASTGFAVISAKDLNDSEWIYYYLTNQSYTDYLTNIASGAAYPAFNPSVIIESNILIPPKETRFKIGKVLSSLDDKIEVNNKINAELEAMAKTLYDYWFVQFEFPNEDGKPYKSSGGEMVYNDVLKREIPKGWEIKQLSQITDIITQSINPLKHLKTQFLHYSIPIFDATKGGRLEFGNEIQSNKYLVQKNDILVSKLNPWFNRVAMIQDSLYQQICSTEFVVWRNHTIKEFLYMIATSKPFIEHCSLSASGTSNSHKRVSPKIMINYFLPYEANIAEQFSLLLSSVFKEIASNLNQNQELAQLRDWLLPMLMNGQISVE